MHVHVRGRTDDGGKDEALRSTRRVQVQVVSAPALSAANRRTSLQDPGNLADVCEICPLFSRANYLTSTIRSFLTLIEITSTDSTRSGCRARVAVVLLVTQSLACISTSAAISMQLIPRNHCPRSARHHFSVQSFTITYHSLARECRSGRA